jgi:GLPGLI family protein
VLITTILFVGVGCQTDSSTDQSSNAITEGKIVYQLSYPQFEEDNIFTSMFPREMTFKFKDNNTLNELKTSMAVFSTSLLANNKEKKVTHLVRIANKYSGLEMDSVEIMEEYGKKPAGMTIVATDSTKMIAGYVCKHAFVKFEGDSTKDFSIFYTNEIGIKQPNWCTPFYEINGVLMEARVNKFNIDMQMTAISVVAETYPEEDFIVTKEYQPITVEEMADIFQSF